MKLLCVHPGASFSTHDVYVGLTEGLRERGHQIYEYALDARIARSGQWLMFNWRKGKKVLPQPNPSDILYHAGCELVTRALRIHKEDEPLDSVIAVSGMYLHPDVMVLLKRAGLPVDLLLTESPYDDAPQAKLLPWVRTAWTNERMSAQALGIRYLPHAFRDTVHVPLADAPPDVAAHDVVFVGTGFKERLEMLEAVDWSGIDLGLYGDAWDLLGPRHHLRRYIKGGSVDNTVTAALYRKAKIGLNLYRTSMGFGRNVPRVADAESLNPRAYELAASGCFTISDERAEVVETFGDAVPTFRTAEELEGQVRRWLADDHGREAVARRLPGLVKGQTWAARAAQVEADLRGAGIVAGSDSRRDVA
jgi:hypothetical protein